MHPIAGRFRFTKMPRSSLFYLLFLFQFGLVLPSVHAQPDSIKNRQLVLKSLKGIQKDLNSLIDKHAQNVPLLHATLDTIACRLVANYQHDTIKFPRLPIGTWKLSIEFDPWIYRPHAEGKYRHIWYLSNIGLHTRWSWPGRFEFDYQNELYAIISANTQNIATNEQALSSYWLKDINPAKQTLIIPTCELSIEINDSTIQPILKSKFMRTQELDAHYSLMLISDGLTYFNPIQGMAFSVMNNSLEEKPFISLDPYKKYSLKNLPIPVLDPGTYQFRLLVIFHSTTWLDESQTIIDGPAVLREAKNSSAGYVLSNVIELTF